ncbi:hypothetical protein [Dietzia sp.]|uniref:hypothetical protein n=1 Tax=Dietzia sp. TaxID=1871616 RepID=UPI002FDB544F
MRFRLAVSTIAALSCLTSVGFAATLVSPDEQKSETEAQLAGSSWTVESSSDYGATWTSPLDKLGNGVFPVRVDLGALGEQNVYQPLTLRNQTGSTTPSVVRIQSGELFSGDAEAAKSLQIRMAYSPTGVCSSSLFEEPDVEPIVGTDEPGALDAPSNNVPITLGPGTKSTAGQPETVCIEFSTKRSLDTPLSGDLTLAWPISAQQDPNADPGKTGTPTSSETETVSTTESVAPTSSGAGTGAGKGSGGSAPTTNSGAGSE